MTKQITLLCLLYLYVDILETNRNPKCKQLSCSINYCTTIDQVVVSTVWLEEGGRVVSEQEVEQKIISG